MSRLRQVAVMALAAVAVMVLLAGRVEPARAGTMQTYLVLYKGTAVPADAASTITKAGGTLVYSYSQIGVAIARSDSAGFRGALLKDHRVENASATSAFGSRLSPDLRAVGAGEQAVSVNTPAPGS